MKILILFHDGVILANKRQRKPKSESRLGNLETRATLDTTHWTKTNKTNITKQKTKKMSNKKAPGEATCSRKQSKNILFLVRHPSCYS